MKFFELAKDGGPESRVWGYFLLEIKSLFSIVLLRFEDGSRDAYHSHAFNCISWVLKGKLNEYVPLPEGTTITAANVSQRTMDEIMQSPDLLHATYRPSLKPVSTYRTTNHKVVSKGRAWVLSFRGPWAKEWKETVDGREIVLTNGRKEVSY